MMKTHFSASKIFFSLFNKKKLFFPKDCPIPQEKVNYLLVNKIDPHQVILRQKNLAQMLKSTLRTSNTHCYTRCHFHQRFLRAFFVRTSFWQLFSSYIRLGLGAKILYKKCARLTLMKLTTGVNFINVLSTRFSYENEFLQLRSSLLFFGAKIARGQNVDEIDCRSAIY